MRAAAKYAICLMLLINVSWPENSPSSADEHLAKGKQLYTQEGPKAALPEFEEALQMFRKKGDQHGEAVTLGYVANCYRKMEDLDHALAFAQQALEMKEKLGDRDEIGKTHNQLGLISWERSDYPGAIQHFQQAIEIATSVDDKQLEGSARNNLGLVFDERGDYKQSLEQYQHALELHRASHFERGEGDTLGNIGGVYLLLGRFREALPYYQEALSISERLGLKPASSDDLGNIALCLAGLGDVDGALKSFDRAMEVAHETDLPKEEADWHKGKGSSLASLGRYDAALKEYARAEMVYEHAGLKRELVEALADTGRVYELLGDGVAADDRFHRALQLAREIGNASGETTSLLALGDLERRRKKYDSAEEDFRRALERARAAGDEGNTVAALVQRATNDLDRKRYDSALQNAREGDEIAGHSANRPAMVLSGYVLAEVRRSQGQLAEALEAYSSALTMQEPLRDPEMGWRILYGRGQVLAAQEKTDDAVASYKEAIRIIEETRSAIVEERYRAGYLEDRYQVYVALVELLLKARKPGDALFYSEKLRARAYFDRLGTQAPPVEEPETQRQMRELGEQIRKLRQAIQKEYAAPQQQRREQAIESYSAELAKAERNYEALLDNSHIASASTGVQNTVPQLAEIQHVIPDGTALIEYVVGKQMISIMVVTPASVVGVPVTITSESLSSRTELLRDLITERRPEWTQPAKGLRKVLVDPLRNEGRLANVRQLLIVPDGVLNYVPFAALPTGTQRFLGDDFTIAYLPAAAALMRDRGTRAGRTLLAMAPASAHLPYASAEVQGIGKIFQQRARVVVGRGATKTLFKEIAGDYDYLHLATHASLNRNAPSLSALELEPDKESDGRLELYEIAGMKLRARLITLSACETALGKGYFTDTPGGDEFVGITRAFLGAGGRNVLASLWPVNDESTRDLMVKFYRHLLSADSAEALARAQQEIRAIGRYQHPYYWAPFVMVGPAD